MIATHLGNWQLRDTERIIEGNRELLGETHLLVGMTRIRNEALILPDTLDYLGTQVDAIVAYDDASTDETVEVPARASEGGADRGERGVGARHCRAEARRGPALGSATGDGARAAAA